MPLAAMDPAVAAKLVIYPGMAFMKIAAKARRPSLSNRSVVIDQTFWFVRVLFAEQLEGGWIV